MSSGSNTTNLSLFKPAVGSTGWGESLNANLDILDNALKTAQDTADTALAVANSGGGGGTGVDKSYVHSQGVATATWIVDHNLGKHPSVTVVDSAGTTVVGSVVHNSSNRLTISFNAAFSGTAFCN